MTKKLGEIVVVAPVFREDLDEFEAATEGSFVALASLCHPDAAVRMAYDQSTGLLHVECAICDAPVAQIHVARRDRLN